MKISIALKFSLAVILAVMLPTSDSQRHEVGYLIATEAGHERTYFNTTSAATADSIVNFYLYHELGMPQHSFSTEEGLKHTPFIELRTENITLYLERKEAFRDKKGNLKLKKIKQ